MITGTAFELHPESFLSNFWGHFKLGGVFFFAFIYVVVGCVSCNASYHLVLHADDSLGHNLVEERIPTPIGFCVNRMFNSEVFLQN